MRTPILLAGPAGVGKSTTARALKERYGPHLEVLSFADPLYALASEVTGVSVEYLKAHKEEPLTEASGCYGWAIGKVPRRILQGLGEAVRQLSGGQAWAAIAAGKAGRLAAQGKQVVFDDARHDTEFPLGLVVELRRRGVEYACDHPSSMPPPEAWVALVVYVDGYTPAQVAEHIGLWAAERAAT